MARSKRTLAAVTALALGLLSVVVATAPAASAAPKFGHDISWPQCSTADGGFGLPLPPTTTEFVVVGLTKGLPFTTNPCLADQLTWVRDHAKPAHAYTIAAFPTASQLTTHRASGPWSATTRAGQLSNVGYAEAQFAVDTLTGAGFAPPVVWIDVEPRAAQPWPSSTAQQRLENRYVLEGLMRGLRDHGIAYGLYSFASGWEAITGSWRVPGVPVWATAGRLDYPTEALDRCTQPSFSGGRVYLSQWFDDTRDYDRTCDPYAFTALPVPASTLSGATADFDGDWDNDVLARVASTGELRLYAGTGTGALTAGVRAGVGWQGLSALETPGDVNGDGALDVLARDVAGALWLYRGNGRGGFTTRVQVGSGWNGFSVVVGPGDFTGDQRVDLLARERSTGFLWLYPGDGTGRWLPRVKVGSGWSIFSAVVGPGDVNGDGTADVVARESATGFLWLYPGNGSGGWRARVRIGSGWNAFTAVASAGDLNGDRVPDLLARDRTGVLWLYPRTAAGSWLPKVRVGGGWNAINAIF